MFLPISRPAAMTLAKVSTDNVPTILHVFPTFALGGSQRRFIALVRHFGKRYRHVVKPLQGPTDAAALLDPRETDCEVRQPAAKPGGAGAAIAAARRDLAALRPDLLVTYNWGAMEWGAANLLVGLRHIHIEDGFGPEEAARQLRRRVLFRRLVLNRRSTLVVPSRTLMDIAARTWRIAPARTLYIPNGIPCARFQRAPDPALTATFRGRGPVIGTVATLRREKALDRMIAAFAAVRADADARLVIVGDGPERARLEALAEARGLSGDVTFTGALAQPERIVGAFDIFALSSDTEQMPLSILEAMAAGRAVAATDAGDVKALLAEDNRAFVRPKDDGALADAMTALLRDPALRDRLGAANRARALGMFDEQQMFDAYDRLFAAAGA